MQKKKQKKKKKKKKKKNINKVNNLVACFQTFHWTIISKIFITLWWNCRILNAKRKTRFFQVMLKDH